MGEEKEDAVLSCRLSSARTLAESLNCISSASHKGEEVTISAGGGSGGGLRFTVEDFGCLQICALLEQDSFSQFKCKDEEINLSVSLNELIYCLNIFSGVWDRTTTSLRMEYAGEGSPLVLTMEEKDVTIKSVLTSIEGSRLTDFRFLQSEVVNAVIAQSEPLRDALQEIDSGGDSVAELRMAPEDPKFCFRCSSVSGTACEIYFPDPERNPLFNSFESRRAQVSTYRLNLLRRCSRALSQSESVRMRVNAEGMLSLVMKLRSSASVVRSGCFVEFLVVAEEIDESADPDQDED